MVKFKISCSSEIIKEFFLNIFMAQGIPKNGVELSGREEKT